MPDGFSQKLVRIFLKMAFPLYSLRRALVFPVSLRPLQDKNFGIFWVGAFLSSMGFWIQAVAQAWQVLQLTNSALLLGLVTFTATLPNIALSLLGGVIVDRFDRRHLLIGTQIIYMSTAAFLGIFTTLHIITVWQIILMSLINGTFSSVGQPGWQAFVGDLVGPKQLKQGIALNSTQFNLSRVIGPAVGGISIGVFGIAGSYYLNSLSYLAVIIPLLLMHTRQRERISQQQSMWRGIGEGLSYVKQQPSLQVALMLLFLIAFLIFPYTTLLPIFARDIFHIGASGLGILNAASGIGALTGAILLVLFSERIKHGSLFLLMTCLVGSLTSFILALTTMLDLALLTLIVLGAACVMSTTFTNTMSQILTPVGMRGRVLSIWVTVAFGLAPIGNLVAGWVAQSIGVRSTLAINGGLCAVTALFVAVIYRDRRRDR
jgi:MFS family permease